MQHQRHARALRSAAFSFQDGFVTLYPELCGFASLYKYGISSCRDAHKANITLPR